jgi:hypothetical protein
LDIYVEEGPVLVILTAYIAADSNETAGMSFEITSAEGLSVSPAWAVSLRVENGSSAGGIQASAIYVCDVGFFMDHCTFTAKYCVTGGTATFGDRTIMVIPIPLL